MSIRRVLQVSTRAVVTSLVVLGAIGCEADSFFEPWVVGRWEPTPVKIPILRRLDVIDEGHPDPPNLTQVLPEDLIPQPFEYSIGPGDIVQISIFELRAPGQDYSVQRRIDNLGIYRHPELGPIRAAGLTGVKLEEAVVEIVKRSGTLFEPEVNVLVLNQGQNTFSVIGQPGVNVARIGTFQIFGPEFRLMEAVAQFGVGGQVDRLFVMRQASPEAPAPPPSDAALMVPEPAQDPGNLLLELLDKAADLPDQEQAPAPQTPAPKAPAPKALDKMLDASREPPSWINVDDKWVEVRAAPGVAHDPALHTLPSGAEELPEVIQRVIEVPFDRLRDGDLRYNIMIRPGDIIRVPSPSTGNIYVMGRVPRPGTYGLPGSNRLTLKQLIASAGGVGVTGVPERVDLTRRIDGTHEVTVRLDLREIFHGREPDIFLKPNDLINVGTHFLGYPNAVVRSGFRASYGFGFVLDRNFAFDVFGPNQRRF